MTALFQQLLAQALQLVGHRDAVVGCHGRVTGAHHQLAEAVELPGLRGDRLAILPGGLAIMSAALEELGVAYEPVRVTIAEGDNRKPYKPCKSMRRVMVHCWGADGNDPPTTGSNVTGRRRYSRRGRVVVSGAAQPRMSS